MLQVLQSIFNFSWKIQCMYLVFFILSMKLIRLESIGRFVDKILLGWMDDNRQDVHDFVSMTFHCWFFHYTMMLIGLEMILTLQSKKKNNSSDNSNNSNLVSTMYYIFTINAIQGHLTCLSHACIDVHPILENKLNTLAYMLFLPTAVFMTGIIGCGLLRSRGWYLLPLMSYATYTKQIGFHTITGRGK